MIKKKFCLSFALVFFILTVGTSAFAKPDRLGGNKPSNKRVDYDNDGYRSRRDCNDNDPTIYPGAEEICGDDIDQNCDGTDATCEVTCTDSDGDGSALEGGECGPIDCNDSNGSVYPGALEVCGDTVDQNCDGSDVPCAGGPHEGLTYNDYPRNCLGCHNDEAHEVKDSTHYKWIGAAPDMVNGPDIPQGKLTNAVNSYCINIKGNWPVCGSCHIGRGLEPDLQNTDVDAELENIDCLVCHNEEYARARKRLPNGSMGVENPTDAMVQNIQGPTRANCLMCHAKAGGGDGVKRGDLSLATITNNDPHFDVHMNSSGSDLSCQQCHEFEAHRVIGKGSDLRPTDDTARGSEIACVTCHEGKDTPEGHDENIARHVDRVACQTCHIPTYAKVATETYRDWRLHHDNMSGPGHPYTVRESNLIPEYRFWNRLSDNYLLGDDASITYDAIKDTYPTSRPLGAVDNQDSKLYPFKYKTATQPKTSKDNVLIALDTFEYLKVSGNVTIAVEKGLEGMGYAATEPYEWVDTDTYQMLNHGVTPASEALQCAGCHGNSERLDLQGELGYGLKDETGTVCTQCHGSKEKKPFLTIHDKHVKDKRYDCSWCHAFSRPERGLRMP